MKFEPDCFYHIYNRSYSKGQVFFRPENYDYFVRKLSQLGELASVVAYCLMPNHFHLMIYVADGAPALTRQTAPSGQTGMQSLARKIGTTLSSYTQAINKQEKRTGSIFQPKSKALALVSDHHLISCFHYIHQNPLRANLVKRLEDWPHSSFHEYLSGEGKICNLTIAYSLVGISPDPNLFFQESYSMVPFDPMFE